MTYDIEKCTWCHNPYSPADMENGLCPKCSADEHYAWDQKEKRLYEEAMNDLNQAYDDGEFDDYYEEEDTPPDLYED